MRKYITLAVYARFHHKSSSACERIIQEACDYYDVLERANFEQYLAQHFELFCRSIGVLKSERRPRYVLAQLVHLHFIIFDVAADLEKLDVSLMHTRLKAEIILHARFLYALKDTPDKLQLLKNVSLSTPTDKLLRVFGSANLPYFPYYCGACFFAEYVQKKHELWGGAMHVDPVELLFYSFDRPTVYYSNFLQCHGEDNDTTTAATTAQSPPAYDPPTTTPDAATKPKVARYNELLDILMPHD